MTEKVVNVSMSKTSETGAGHNCLMPSSLLLCLGTAVFLLLYRCKK